MAKKLKPYRLPEWARQAVGPVVGFVLMARGLVFAIVGGFLLLAAWHARRGNWVPSLRKKCRRSKTSCA